MTINPAMLARIRHRAAAFNQPVLLDLADELERFGLTKLGPIVAR